MWFSGFGLPGLVLWWWPVAVDCVIGLVCRFCGCGWLFALRGSWCFVGFLCAWFCGLLAYLEFDVCVSALLGLAMMWVLDWLG